MEYQNEKHAARNSWKRQKGKEKPQVMHTNSGTSLFKYNLTKLLTNLRHLQFPSRKEIVYLNKSAL